MTRTVAGLVPFTSIDYPSYLAAVIFFQGCPLRCPFCHNPNLQPAQGENLTPWVEVMTFLKGRGGFFGGRTTDANGNCRHDSRGESAGL